MNVSLSCVLVCPYADSVIRASHVHSKPQGESWGHASVPTRNLTGSRVPLHVNIVNQQVTHKVAVRTIVLQGYFPLALRNGIIERSYNRTDIRRYLTQTERWELSRDIRRALLNCSLLKPTCYRELLRVII